MKPFVIFAHFFILLAVFPLHYLSAAERIQDMKKNEMIVFDFKAPDDINNWRVVNDGVMGGLSQSEIIPSGNDTAVFQGTLSLENNGGFSSTRTIPGPLKMNGYDALVIRIKGDGRAYQFRLRTDDRFDGIAYRQKFTTVSNEWMTVRLPFDDFVPVFRGRELKNAEPLSADKIQQIGFLISDQKPGPFRLEIDWIKALRP